MGDKAGTGERMVLGGPQGFVRKTAMSPGQVRAEMSGRPIYGDRPGLQQLMDRDRKEAIIQEEAAALFSPF